MSTSGNRSARSTGSSDGLLARKGELPAFELVCLFDDLEAPTEVTVFEPDSPDITATWISTDAAHAVPLERAR